MKISLGRRLAFTAILVAYFLLGYFTIGYLDKPGIDAVTWIDNAVPFVPVFLIFYVLGYLFVFLPLFFTGEKREFFVLFWTYAAVLTVSFLAFYILPIEQLLNLQYGTDIFSRIMRLWHSSDPKFNNFPSLHVSLNFLSYLVLLTKLNSRRKYLALLIFPIIISVLFVKEHLFLDVVGGIVMAVAAFLAYLLMKKTSYS